MNAKTSSREKERTRTVGAVLVGVLLVGTGAACSSDEPSNPSSDASSEQNSAPASTGVVPAAGAASGDEELPQGSERVQLDPAGFTTEITNPWWPMAPGSHWIYREIDTEGTVQKVVVTVTDETKTIANGVEAVVVHDVVTEDGLKVEVTDDWYAQDSAGNIWYLGEDTTEYENGKPVSKQGSFEAGVDGAQAGVLMPADPQVGMSYRQEYYKGEAEDEGEIFGAGLQAQVPAGHYADAVMTKDLNPLEPRILEFKFFARDVGPVLAISLSGGSDREELLSYQPG